jgi:hypothetical protein
MNKMKVIGVVVALAVLVGLGWLYKERLEANAEEKRLRGEATAQCRKWADKLDAQTTETGVYLRWQGEMLPEADPWGQNLRIRYSQDGLGESLTVCSAGPDGEIDTVDDLRVVRIAANLKGIGLGVKKNIEETSRSAARGVVRGIGDALRNPE